MSIITRCSLGWRHGRIVWSACCHSPNSGAKHIVGICLCVGWSRNTTSPCQTVWYDSCHCGRIRFDRIVHIGSPLCTVWVKVSRKGCTRIYCLEHRVSTGKKNLIGTCCTSRVTLIKHASCLRHQSPLCILIGNTRVLSLQCEFIHRRSDKHISGRNL